MRFYTLDSGDHSASVIINRGRRGDQGLYVALLSPNSLTPSIRSSTKGRNSFGRSVLQGLTTSQCDEEGVGPDQNPPDRPLVKATTGRSHAGTSYEPD